MSLKKLVGGALGIVGVVGAYKVNSFLFAGSAEEVC